MSRNSVREFPAPRHPSFGKPMWCKWCGEKIPIEIDGNRSTQRLWHPACVYQFELHTRLAVQKYFLIKRDSQRCAWQDCGAPPERWLRGYELHRTQGLGWLEDDYLATLWPRCDIPWREQTAEQKATGWHIEIERVCALEVDHRVPLWSVAHLDDDERRPYFGPGNLWLLCPLHHKAKTKAEAAQRANAKRSKIRDKAAQLAFEIECSTGKAICRK